MLLDRLHRPVRGVRIARRQAAGDGDDEIGAQIIPHRKLSSGEVERLLAQLSDVKGAIVTSALNTAEQEPFRTAGFAEREDLYLLNHNMVNRPARVRGAHRLRSGRRSDLATVLDIDRQSFDEFWALDKEGLHSARKATPVHQYQVATLDREVVGYAITGRSGRSSFLQRLGVAPHVRGRGIGTDLIANALEWAASGSAVSMLVNTQTRNERAKRLYESLGFTLSEERLVVLQWTRPR